MFDVNNTGPVPVDLATRTEFSKVEVPIHLLVDTVLQNGGAGIEGHRFVDCVVRGPAILIPGPSTRFLHCNFGDVAGDVRNLFLRAAGPKIIGAVPVDRCVFEGCLFLGVGLAGDDVFVDQFASVLNTPKGVIL